LRQIEMEIRGGQIARREFIPKQKWNFIRWKVKYIYEPES